MERIWCMRRHREQTRGSYIAYPYLLHICQLPHHGISSDHLHDPRFLDEYEKLYPERQEKPATIFVITDYELRITAHLVK